jgi:hypothetical protein
MTPASDDERPQSPGARPAKGAARRGRAQTARSRDGAALTPEAGGVERGILSNLPSTRPQRPSARRAAAKRAAAKRADAAPAARPTAEKPAAAAAKRAGASAEPTARRAAAKRAKPAPAKRRTALAAAPPREPLVPPQGFEGEDEIEPGTPVQPPSRPEVAGALAELVGELAQTGLARGGRLVKEALGRLPGI